jgi:hypothetical protein
MIYLLTISLMFVLTLPTVYAADARGLREVTTLCETYLPHMRTVMATLKQGTPLTDGQEAMWRVWNRDCKDASWQKALAEGLPPVPVQPDFGYRPPPSAPTFREYAIAALQGLERGLTAPMVYCRSRTSVRYGNAYTYSYCY